MDIIASTHRYKEWLGDQLTLVPDDLRTKDKLMAEDPFPFLRATYYRWTERFPVVCPELAGTMCVHAVGDLHVQNFGTWRDLEGRLVWGVNDFDEADLLPFASDLVRLAVSAHLLKNASDGIAYRRHEIAPAILKGYRRSLRRNGCPWVLDKDDSWLRRLATHALGEAGNFWEKWLSEEKSREATKKDDVTAEAKAALCGAFAQVHAKPDEMQWRVRGTRPKGLGSLGRQRFFGYIENWRGGPLAREAKAAALPASQMGQPASAAAIRFSQVIGSAIRSPDPFYTTEGTWTVRPIVAAAGRIDFEDLEDDMVELKLLSAMGFETANIHLGTGPDTAARLTAALDKLDDDWLERATVAMLDDIEADFAVWRRHRKKEKQKKP